MAAEQTMRGWLLAEIPESKLQARCQRIFISWLAFIRNPVAVIGLLIIVGLVAIAALAPWITTSDGLEPDLTNRLLAPSSEHWFGTDGLGRDIFDRIIWGSRITLYIVALVSVIVVPIGLLIGTVAGYMGGLVDTILMRLTDIFLAFPRLILAMALVAALGPGLENAVLAIALTTWSPFARIARAEALTIRNSEHHSNRGRARFSRSRSATAYSGMGCDDFAGSTVPDRPVVGANLLGDGLRDVFDPKSGG